jgi:hypothetical protein
MRQRRGMNFMGISYMGWKKKGKGFLRGGRGAGGRREVQRRPSCSLFAIFPP